MFKLLFIIGLSNLLLNSCKTAPKSDKASAVKGEYGQSASSFKFVPQTWSKEERREFWYLSQGSYIIPYNWFLALSNNKQEPFISNMDAFGYIQVDGKDKLPIGFTKEEPTDKFPTLKDNGQWLGISCAGCHVGSIKHEGKEVIIEGAPAMTEFRNFSVALETELRHAIEKDYDNFAYRVAARGTPIPSREEAELVLKNFAERNNRSFKRRDGSLIACGPSRTDAFSVILNEVTAANLGEDTNLRDADSPVSYPHVWGAPQLRWVQWNGLTNNAFTRNIGETLGVFARLEMDPNKPNFLSTTTNFKGIIRLEELLRTLSPPKYEDVFGKGSIDRDLSWAGKGVFDAECASCHATPANVVTNTFGARFNDVTMVSLGVLGTDPEFFINLQQRGNSKTVHFTNSSVLAKIRPMLPKLKFANDDLKNRIMSRFAGNPSAPLKAEDNGVRLLAETTFAIALKYIIENDIVIGSPEFANLTGGADFEQQSKLGAFKARSLEGIWATAPYLHNGSVRTLAELLKPVERREATFKIGAKDFDKDAVGYQSEGRFVFNTAQTGNSNAGHKWGTDLDETKKLALIEYLKSL